MLKKKKMVAITLVDTKIMLDMGKESFITMMAVIMMVIGLKVCILDMEPLILRWEMRIVCYTTPSPQDSRIETSWWCLPQRVWKMLMGYDCYGDWYDCYGDWYDYYDCWCRSRWSKVLMADHVLEELAQGDGLVPELPVADHKVVEVVPVAVAGHKGSSCRCLRT